MGNSKKCLIVFTWEERLQAPKDDKKDDPPVWAASFPYLITLTQITAREKLKPEGNDNLQKINYNWTITNYKHLALRKMRKHVKGLPGPCGQCALYGNYGKHNKSMGPCASQIMSKTKTCHSTKN